MDATDFGVLHPWWAAVIFLVAFLIVISAGKGK